MWIWIALAVVVLAAVVLVYRRPARGQGAAPGGVLGVRVTWPPGYGSTVRARVVRRPDALYVIHEFPDRPAALEFLRGVEVRQERLYVIAETPAGNLGKDLVMIFEEADGSFVEMARRSPLTEARWSGEDCARCGYPVIPMTDPMADFTGTEVGTVSWHLALDDLEREGAGYRCTTCGALACAACYLASPAERDADGSLDLRCWMPGCGGATTPFVE